MTRHIFPSSLLLSLTLTCALIAPAMAHPNFLPHIRVPQINGGKTLLKVRGAADALGIVPSISPPTARIFVRSSMCLRSSRFLLRRMPTISFFPTTT